MRHFYGRSCRLSRLQIFLKHFVFTVLFYLMPGCSFIKAPEIHCCLSDGQEGATSLAAAPESTGNEAPSFNVAPPETHGAISSPARLQPLLKSIEALTRSGQKKDLDREIDQLTRVLEKIDKQAGQLNERYKALLEKFVGLSKQLEPANGFQAVAKEAG